MIIVLEGPDGVGKSTLAAALESASELGTVPFNHGPPDPDSMPALEYEESIRAMIKESESGSMVISDRLHVGEIAYGTILRGGSRLTMDEASVLDMMLDARCAALIHCTVDPATMMERLMRRNGGAADEKSGSGPRHSMALRAAYVGLLGREGRRGILPGCWETIEMDSYPDQIAARVLARATFGWRLRAPDGWVGHPSSSTVLVLPPGAGGMEHLSWMAGQLRFMGELRGTAMVSPTYSAADADVLADRLEGKVVVPLGKAAGTMDVLGIPCTKPVRHRPDEHLYDSAGEWRSSLASVLEAHRSEGDGRAASGAVG